MGPERIIQNDILRYLWSRDIYCFQIKTTGTWDPTRATFRKPSPMYKRGVADILGILPDGKFFAIEVKSKVGRLRPEQKQFLDEITQRSGIAGLCRSVEDVKKLLGGYLVESSRTPSVSVSSE